MASNYWRTPVLCIVAAGVLGAGLAEGAQEVFRYFDPLPAAPAGPPRE